MLINKTEKIVISKYCYFKTERERSFITKNNKMNNIFYVFLSILLIQGIYALLKFKYIKGRKFQTSVYFRAKTPTMYQCAELCITFKDCESINFDMKNKICYISEYIWSLTYLATNNDFIYAEKMDIP